MANIANLTKKALRDIITVEELAFVSQRVNETFEDIDAYYSKFNVSQVNDFHKAYEKYNELHALEAETADDKTAETATETADSKPETAETADSKPDKKSDSKTADDKPETFDNNVKFELTGTFCNATIRLINEMATWFENDIIPAKITIHGDDRKKKVMIRFEKKLVTKVFVQRAGYKMHLKTLDDYRENDINTGDVFYQNGFNLAYAKKITSLDPVKTVLYNYIANALHTTEVEPETAETAEEA